MILAGLAALATAAVSRLLALPQQPTQSEQATITHIVLQANPTNAPSNRLTIRTDDGRTVAVKASPAGFDCHAGQRVKVARSGAAIWMAGTRCQAPSEWIGPRR